MPSPDSGTRVRISRPHGGGASFAVESYDQAVRAIERLAAFVPRDATWVVIEGGS